MTADCTSACRNNTEFLPAALILGLQPGVPLVIPIVVVAEDGVTSQRYFVSGRLMPRCHFRSCGLLIWLVVTSACVCIFMSDAMIPGAACKACFVTWHI